MAENNKNIDKKNSGHDTENIVISDNTQSLETQEDSINFNDIEVDGRNLEKLNLEELIKQYQANQQSIEDIKGEKAKLYSWPWSGGFSFNFVTGGRERILLFIPLTLIFFLLFFFVSFKETNYKLKTDNENQIIFSYQNTETGKTVLPYNALSSKQAWQLLSFYIYDYERGNTRQYLPKEDMRLANAPASNTCEGWLSSQSNSSLVHYKSMLQNFYQAANPNYENEPKLNKTRELINSNLSDIDDFKKKLRENFKLDSGNEVGVDNGQSNTGGDCYGIIQLLWNERIRLNSEIQSGVEKQNEDVINRAKRVLAIYEYLNQDDSNLEGEQKKLATSLRALLTYANLKDNYIREKPLLDYLINDMNSDIAPSVAIDVQYQVDQNTENVSSPHCELLFEQSKFSFSNNYKADCQDSSSSINNIWNELRSYSSIIVNNNELYTNESLFDSLSNSKKISFCDANKKLCIVSTETNWSKVAIFALMYLVLFGCIYAIITWMKYSSLNKQLKELEEKSGVLAQVIDFKYKKIKSKEKFLNDYQQGIKELKDQGDIIIQDAQQKIVSINRQIQALRQRINNIS